MDDQRGESATRAPEEAGGRRRFAPRSFRGKIVLSTVALMTLAMVVVGFGIQLVLGIAAQRDITQVLDDRSEATITIIQQASKAELTVPPDTLEPGEQVYDSDGTLVAGSIEHDARSSTTSATPPPTSPPPTPCAPCRDPPTRSGSSGRRSRHRAATLECWW